MCQEFARFCKFLKGFACSARFCRLLQAFACFNKVFQVSVTFCRFLQGFAGSELEPREAVEAKRLYKTVFAKL